MDAAWDFPLDHLVGPVRTGSWIRWASFGMMQQRSSFVLRESSFFGLHVFSDALFNISIPAELSVLLADLSSTEHLPSASKRRIIRDNLLVL